jgi:prevent-host-death family protein
MAKRISASDAKNNFGGLLEDVAELGRVDIIRHGRLVAVVLAPRALDAALPKGGGAHPHGEWGAKLAADRCHDYGKERFAAEAFSYVDSIFKTRLIASMSASMAPSADAVLTRSMIRRLRMVAQADRRRRSYWRDRSLRRTP